MSERKTESVQTSQKRVHSDRINPLAMSVTRADFAGPKWPNSEHYIPCLERKEVVSILFPTLELNGMQYVPSYWCKCM